MKHLSGSPCVSGLAGQSPGKRRRCSASQVERRGWTKSFRYSNLDPANEHLKSLYEPIVTLAAQQPGLLASRH